MNDLRQISRRGFLGTSVAARFLSNSAGGAVSADFSERGCRDRRQEVLAELELVMGPFPKKNKPPLDINIIDTDDLPRCTRAKITYMSEEGDRVPAFLLKPKSPDGKVPGILCPHPTTVLGAGSPAGLGGDLDWRYALELAERGYVTIAPCYPDLPFTQGFGGYRYDAYRCGYQSTTMKGIWNHVRAVDLLQSLPEVNQEQIGCIGHSLGGHNTLFVGAFDTRIKVLVSSCGFTSFARYMGGELSAWAQERYMPLVALKYHNNPAEMPFDFSDVLTALAPRPLFVNAPLHDDNFDVAGVDDTLRLLRTACSSDYGTGDRLVVRHPDAAHSFPREVRQEAYAFFDKWLRPAPA